MITKLFCVAKTWKGDNTDSIFIVINYLKRCRADFQANLEKSFGELDEVIDSF